MVAVVVVAVCVRIVVARSIFYSIRVSRSNARTSFALFGSWSPWEEFVGGATVALVVALDLGVCTFVSGIWKL